MQEAQRAHAAVKASQARRAELLLEIVDIERQRDADADKLARMEETELAEETARIIGAPDAPAEKPKRQSAIANLRSSKPAYAAAIELKRRAIEEIDAQIQDLQIPLSRAALHLVTETQGDAIAQIRDALMGLLEPAARLFAADQIHAALLGTGEFKIPQGAPIPIRGQVLMANVMKGLPANIRPAELNHDSLFQAARAISAEILQSINEGKAND